MKLQQSNSPVVQTLKRPAWDDTGSSEGFSGDAEVFACFSGEPPLAEHRFSCLTRLSDTLDRSHLQPHHQLFSQGRIL